MRSVLRKLYTLAPLVIVAFFFQNCTNSKRPHKTPYAGISDVSTPASADVSKQ